MTEARARRRRGAIGARALACALALGALAARSAATPRSGDALPPIQAEDVTGQRRELRDLVRGPTLLVAIVDRDAGDAMRAWFEAAARRAPRAHQISIISIGKPFFVSDSYARSKAREKVPPAHWHASLFDTDHAMARQLGLGDDKLPYAFAVSGDGRVLAWVHAPADSPRAEALWAALR